MEEKLSPTFEDYLISIYRIESEKRVARARDIGRLHHVAKSTVTAALQTLSNRALINYEPYEAVTLTPEGRKRAEGLVVRHRILADFLTNVMGLDAEKAEKTACGMEHAMEDDVVEYFVCFLAFLQKNSKSGKTWLEEFRKFARRPGRKAACQKCMKEYLNGLLPGHTNTSKPSARSATTT